MLEHTDNKIEQATQSTPDSVPNETPNSNNITTIGGLKDKLLAIEEWETVELGTEKVVEIRKWKGQELIDYSKAIKNANENDDSNDILINQLVKPVIRNTDNHYINDEEALYLLTLIRMKSLPTKPLTYYVSCENPECDFHDELNISDFTRKTKLSSFGQIVLDNGLTLHLKNVKNAKSLEKKDAKEKNIINEILMKVDYIEYGGTKIETIIFNDLYSIIMNLESDTFESFLKQYKDNFMFDDTIDDQTLVCPLCKTSNTIYLNDIFLFIEGI